MNKKSECPICASTHIIDLYTIEVPVLQNKVFVNISDAVASMKGSICISSCSDCSFVFNSTFDNEILIYDTSYDNSVPSTLFKQYYNDIADYLYNNYDLKNGTLYDVGCGKGTFTKLLCEKYPDVIAIGIDPSYEGDLAYSNNLSFIQDFFDSKYAIEKPSLVICRHVFEHIEHPTSFLNIISNALKSHLDVPIFIEVPDLTWIIKNEAFWDICYEHCNYFNPRALSTMADRSNSELKKISPGFNNQYLWSEVVLNTSNKNKENKEENTFSFESLSQFTSGIQNLIVNSKDILNRYKSDGYSIAVWGMATKGVEYCNIVDKEKSLVDYCVDINENKQNKFIPFTGHQIQSPDFLLSIKKNLLVVIMNTNYIAEIKQFIDNNSLKAIYLNGHGVII